jgi:hypothetical protein
MFSYSGACTNDECWQETFALKTDLDVSTWVFECVISDRAGVRARADVSLDPALKEVTFTVPLSGMQGLPAAQYGVGARYRIGSADPKQILIGVLAVKEGNFTP